MLNIIEVKMELRIKEILSQRGITMKEFSISSGISQSNLSNYINGNISPTLDTLKKIAASLNIDIIELFKEKDSIEIYIKYNGSFHLTSKNDIVNLILKKNDK